MAITVGKIFVHIIVILMSTILKNSECLLKINKTPSGSAAHFNRNSRSAVIDPNSRYYIKFKEDPPIFDRHAIDIDFDPKQKWRKPIVKYIVLSYPTNPLVIPSEHTSTGLIRVTTLNHGEIDTFLELAFAQWEVLLPFKFERTEGADEDIIIESYKMAKLWTRFGNSLAFNSDVVWDIRRSGPHESIQTVSFLAAALYAIGDILGMPFNPFVSSVMNNYIEPYTAEPLDVRDIHKMHDKYHVNWNKDQIKVIFKCEYKRVTIDCEQADQVMIIISAEYGNMKHWGDNRCDSYVGAIDRTCTMLSTIATRRCHLQRSCSFDVNNEMAGGDPCSSMIKVMRIRYLCIKESLIVRNRYCTCPATHLPVPGK